MLVLSQLVMYGILPLVLHNVYIPCVASVHCYV